MGFATTKHQSQPVASGAVAALPIRGYPMMRDRVTNRQLDAISSILLGPVERGVGGSQKGLPALAVFGKDGHTE